MRLHAKLLRTAFPILLLLVIASACTLNGALPPAMDFADSHSPLRHIVEWVVVLMEGAGIAVILLGTIVATIHFIIRTLQEKFSMPRYHRYREQLGEVILLGLEFLVAADIVGTVAIAPTIENIVSLAAIIIVRTFLSFTLEVETTGYWPWQRSGQSRIGVRQHVRRRDKEILTDE